MYEKYKELKISRRGRILTVTMDNPPMNATTPVSHRELAMIFEEINHDRDTDVVVLTGGGERAFSAGGDIVAMLDRYEKNDHAKWHNQMQEARHIIYGLLRLEKPLIGRINGHAMGLGATIAALCDISFMIGKSKIADTHVHAGLTAGDGGALIWPFLVGFGRAKYHLLTGEALTGVQAAELGLITKAVENHEELDREVNAMADRLANGASFAISTTKMALNLVLRTILEGMVETHLGLETKSAWTKEHYEATLAFRDKRPPDFSKTKD